MSTVNLDYASNYHVLFDGENYSVEYFLNGKIYRKSIFQNATSKPEVVDYCEERVFLSDGYVFKRTRDSFVIIKE